MTTFLHAPHAAKAVLFSIAVGSSLALAPTSVADPVVPRAGDASASDTVNTLQSSGFPTQINFLEGNPNVPLNECKVTAIRNPNGAMASMVMLSTVYVDVACPNAK